MEIVASQTDARVPVTVLTIRGQINADTAPELQAEAEKAIKSGARHLLLDLTEAPYISSAGLRVLAYLMVLLRKWSDASPDTSRPRKTATRNSPYLKILGPSPEVMRTLRMVGFDLYLDIYSDYHEALRAF
jgi:stage II sporulation protein AA (anti-sigma F factor antagonist)